jgi:hypothetical protein
VPFDDATLTLLDATKEVEIETTKPDGSTQRTIIWVVVDEGAVFARSWLGDRGRWFQAALDKPAEVALHADGRRLPVTAVLADDDESIERCSRGLQAKYRRSAASLASMLVPDILGTTVRLDPR